jgi:DNA-binding transcriptional MerR regulator
MTYRIGEVARMMRISTQSLRLWEKSETFPRVKRNLLARRSYTDEDIQAIKDFISKKHPQVQIK